MILRGRRSGSTRIEDIVAVMRFDGTILCMSCADDKDLGSILSEDDLITSQNIRDDDCYICARCGKEIKG
ncbi:MAG: hypothetical protein M0P57_10565 [Syntrophales bacterium]|jgi:hypothetical protein|nr:hypothetical protein [Syntrophales bacterium]MDY0044103.1 hypothetical protein [Syntrophales bacterium]